MVAAEDAAITCRTKVAFVADAYSWWGRFYETVAEGTLSLTPFAYLADGRASLFPAEDQVRMVLCRHSFKD